MEQNDIAKRYFHQAESIFEGIRDSFGARMASDVSEVVLRENAEIMSGREVCEQELIEIQRLLELSQEMKSGIHL